MPMNEPHYLPLTLPFFSILVGIFVFLVTLVEVTALGVVFRRIGLSPRAAMLVLLGSLVGSYFNIPIGELPGGQVISGAEITYFGMHYVVPRVLDWPGTVLAVNVGGAVIPTLVSLYLFAKDRLWLRGVVAVICVAIVTHALAHPVRGLGIALPVFAPALTTAIVALVLSRRHATALAYIGGSLGTLIGADLLNLSALRGLEVPVASIGGAGTFDGIFVTGVVAVLLAAMSGAGEEDGTDTANR